MRKRKGTTKAKEEPANYCYIRVGKKGCIAVWITPTCTYLEFSRPIVKTDTKEAVRIQGINSYLRVKNKIHTRLTFGPKATVSLFLLLALALKKETRMNLDWPGFNDWLSQLKKD